MTAWDAEVGVRQPRCGRPEGGRGRRQLLVCRRGPRLLLQLFSQKDSVINILPESVLTHLSVFMCVNPQLSKWFSPSVCITLSILRVWRTNCVPIVGKIT